MINGLHIHFDCLMSVSFVPFVPCQLHPFIHVLQSSELGSTSLMPVAFQGSAALIGYYSGAAQLLLEKQLLVSWA